MAPLVSMLPALLANWLAELEAESLSFSDEEFGGANANLWSLSFSRDTVPCAEHLAEFIHAALEVRRTQARDIGVQPATFCRESRSERIASHVGGGPTR